MDSRKCFVGGLARGTTIDSLVEHFNQFGMVQEIIIPKSPEDGTQRGFAFVTFKESAGALTAMEAPASTHVVDGKQVDVKPCLDRRINAAGGSQTNQPNSMGNKQIPTGELDPKKIFIGGLPPEATEESIRQVFAPYGPVLHVVVMMDSVSGRPKGFGFVTFDSAEICDQLVAEQYVNYLNKKIEIKRAIMSRPFGRYNGPANTRTGNRYTGPPRDRAGYHGRNPTGGGDETFHRNNAEVFSYPTFNHQFQQQHIGNGPPLQGQPQWSPTYNQFAHQPPIEFSPEMYNAGFAGFTAYDMSGIQFAYPYVYPGLEGFKPMVLEPEYPGQMRAVGNAHMAGFVPLSPNHAQSTVTLINPPGLPHHIVRNNSFSARCHGSAGGAPVGLYHRHHINLSPRGPYNNYSGGGHGQAKNSANENFAGPGQSMTGSGDSVSGGSYKDNPYGRS